MAINKTIKITWDGKPYKINMTMRLIDQIEEDINLLQLVNRVTQGDIRYSHCAHLIALLLSSAGCEVTQDQVFEGMFAGDDFTPTDLIDVMYEIFNVIFPTTKKKASEAK